MERNYGRLIDIDASLPEDRKNIRELTPKRYRHRLVYNCASFEFNDGAHSAAINEQFYFNALTRFPPVVVLHLHALLMKDMTGKYFK